MKENFVRKHDLFCCIQCGACTGGCPVSIKSKLNTRVLVYRTIAHGGLDAAYAKDELWSCTTCSTCGKQCPRGLSPFEVVIGMRGILVEEGRVPPEVRVALENVYKHGNPWGKIRSKRSEWAAGLKVKNISEVGSSGLLYFVCCAASYDPRVQEVAKSIVRVFDEAGVNFGILGSEESCCGNEVYGMGEKGLFEILVEDNMKLFEKYGVSKIVTTSPHCYNAFKNMYKDASFEAQHYTQYISNLIDVGKLKFSKRIDKVVTFQDSCFLGKHNDVYEEPRKIIESIPGLKLVELDRSGKRSLCCEGGGGRMWVDAPGERLAESRVRDAVDLKAEVIATSCPFCLLTIEDAIKTMDKESVVKVMDIMELASQAV